MGGIPVRACQPSFGQAEEEIALTNKDFGPCVAVCFCSARLQASMFLSEPCPPEGGRYMSQEQTRQAEARPTFAWDESYPGPGSVRAHLRGARLEILAGGLPYG